MRWKSDTEGVLRVRGRIVGIGSRRWSGIKRAFLCNVHSKLLRGMQVESLGQVEIQRTDRGILYSGRLPMTKADIVNAIAGTTGLTKRDVSDVVELLLATVVEALSRGDRIEIRGFGTFKTVRRASRVARNPRKGEAIAIPARNLPVFQPSKEFRSLVEQDLPVRR